MAKKEIVDELSTIDTQEIDPSQVVPKTENEIPKIKPEMGSKKLITGLVFGTVCLLILGFIFWKKGSSFSVNKFNQNRGSVSLDSKNQTFTAPNFQTTTYFAQYPIEQTPISPKIPPYEISVNELNNWSDFENENGVAFSQPQIDSLQTNHFFLTPNLDQFYSENPNDPNMRYDDWTHLYDEIGGSNSIYFRKPQDAVFITSDFLLHVYHRLLEKEMEYIEVTQFYPRLTQLSNTLLDQAIKHYNIADSPNDKASYERIITFFERYPFSKRSVYHC